MAELERLTTRISIEMTGDTKRYLVSAKQGDKATRYIIAKLLNDGVAYIIPEGARVAFNVEKPDGKHIYNTCTYSSSEVTIELTNQTLAAAGTAYCDIEVRTSDNTQLITSASFTIEIEKSVRSNDAILSSNEYTELEERIRGHIASLDDTEEKARLAEEERQEAEKNRVIEESKRANAEDIRDQNENIRVEQEEIRVSQENERQKNIIKAVQDAENATVKAEEATRVCREVTERAENSIENEEQLRQTLETAKDIQENVSEMKSAVETAKREVENSFGGHIEDKNNPHGVTKDQVGLGNADNTADMNKPVSTAQQTALDELYQQLTAYTRSKIAELINGADETMDTLKEVGDAIAAHKDVLDALNAAIGKKASAAEFDSHVKDTTKHITSTERTSWTAKMETTGDSANNTITFISGDATNPTGWADIEAIASGEKHSNLARKFSLAVKNLRYLWKLLGSTSLSGIGDGTVTGAIGALNTGLSDINSVLTVANVKSKITLPANMSFDDAKELCRTGVLEPGTYLVGYRMANYSIDTTYSINLSTTGTYVSILAGQNGVDVIRLKAAAALYIVAQNRGSGAYTVEVSNNNRMYAFRLK